MSEQEAFGPNLRRIRVQRGISLDSIAEATKISPDLLVGLESNDLSRWPSGLYARAYIRAYAMHIGVDADAAVNDFCRWFPQGDRRAERIVREQAAIVVQADDYTVFLTNTQTGQRTQTTSFHNTDAERGRSPGFIGVQAYSGNTVAWRHIRIKV